MKEMGWGKNLGKFCLGGGTGNPCTPQQSPRSRGIHSKAQTALSIPRRWGKIKLNLNLKKKLKKSREK